MRAVTDGTFEQEVLRSARPVVVDFWAPSCGPCRTVSALLSELAAEHAGRIDFVSLDVDANPLAAARYRVLTLPTTIVFAAGEPRDTLLGARRRSAYEQALAPLL